MRCTTCDTPNDESARFCRVCGTPLGRPEPAAGTGVTQALAPPPRCAACGRGNPVGARYCVFCASRLEITPAFSAPLAPVAGFTAPANAATFRLAGGDPLQLVLRGIWFLAIGW